MLLFNWKKVYDKSQGSTNAIVDILNMIYYKRIPYNKYDPLYKYVDINFSGDSFLLNPKGLLENAHKYSSKEIAVYTAIAARRKLSDYLAFGTKTLSISYTPDNTLSLLTKNRLLHVEGTKIFFIFEEAHRRK